jgi:hypothetical protein
MAPAKRRTAASAVESMAIANLFQTWVRPTPTDSISWYSKAMALSPKIPNILTRFYLFSKIKT